VNAVHQTSVNWTALEGSFLISWQLFVCHLSHRRLLALKSEMGIFFSPTEVAWSARPSRLRYLLHQGHTGDAREDAHMVIVTLKQCFGKPRPGALKRRWCPIPPVAYKAETKSLKKWWQRSILVSKTKVGDGMSEGFGSGILLGYRRSCHCSSFLSCSVVVSQPMKQSNSETSNGLTSPPSHRKPQNYGL